MKQEHALAVGVYLFANALTFLNGSLQSQKINAVSEMYNDIPYPPITDEYIEAERAHYSQSSTPLRLVRPLMLQTINSKLFQGLGSLEGGFSGLVAGGGTGTATCFLAEQLGNFDGGKVTYLDFSKASLKIAEKRAQIRILSDSLADNGGMTVMVYAKSGRTGLYQLQDMLKIINDNITNRQQEIENTRKLLNSFTSPVRAARFDRVGKDFPVRKSSPEVDGELYDRYCHKQDKPFTTSEFFKMVKGAGLYTVDRFGTNRLESDYLSIKDDHVRKIFSELEKENRAEAEELFFGVQNEHSYFLSKKENSQVPISEKNLDVIPVVFDAEAESLFEQIGVKSRGMRDGERTVAKIQLKRGNKLQSIHLILSKYSAFITQLFGENLSIKEMYQQFQERFETVKLKEFFLHFEDLYNGLSKAEVVYLKKPS
uniref:Methyltransferase n=1 Tax=Pseudodiaptomus poplesia TaxID=213370 RepID=A0A1S6GL77_9MAXI|nr:methyltransferase [Pseudodiaptomus poplesia]